MIRAAFATAAVLALAVPAASYACPGTEAKADAAEATCAHAKMAAAHEKGEGHAEMAAHEKGEGHACTCGHGAKTAYRTATVDEVAHMRAEKTVDVVDVNTASTREKYGVIPAARLLSSSSRYDPTAELPAEKDARLVFYCANTKCTASKTAAERAAKAGYTEVFVMPAGIKGWVEAGQPVSKPNS